MLSLDGMSEYLLDRPMLMGVGMAAKLVIGGIEQATGVEQTENKPRTQAYILAILIVCGVKLTANQYEYEYEGHTGNC